MRIRKQIDLPMKQNLLSFIFFGAAIICIPVIIYYYKEHNSLNTKFTLVYGVVLIMGWLSSLILGQTFKTLPFIVWARSYEHLTGKVKTPMPADLYNTRILQLQTIAFIAFCIAFMSGCLLGSSLLIGFGSVALVVTAAAYIINVVIVVLHKTRSYDEL